MGNKYDLLENLFIHFPKKEEELIFIDLFGGSGVVSVNSPYQNVIYNELKDTTFKLFKMFATENSENIIKKIEDNIEKFSLKAKQKTYYDFREYANKTKNVIDLYNISFYSFCNIIRTNSNGEINIPVGNCKYIKGEHDINIKLFIDKIKQKKILLKNENAFDILKKIKKEEKVFIYLDPPYSNTNAIYNEKNSGGWSIEEDLLLFKELERIDKLGIKWAMSNVLKNKGKHNKHLEEWANKNNFKIISFDDKNYASLGKGNAKTQEVLIINYTPPFEQLSLFDI